MAVIAVGQRRDDEARIGFALDLLGARDPLGLADDAALAAPGLLLAGPPGKILEIACRLAPVAQVPLSHGRQLACNLVNQA
jgi:hypothetical protein